MSQRLHRFVALLILILVPAIATAQSERPEPDALRGLSTVDLVVEAFGELPDPKQATLAMRTAIEARLGLNGIKAEYDAAKAATTSSTTPTT
jgi:lipopolysaccharide biosynthesis protein